MRGSVYKRCTCPVRRDARGRVVTCPKKHGTWTFRVEHRPVGCSFDWPAREESRRCARSADALGHPHEVVVADAALAVGGLKSLR